MWIETCLAVPIHPCIQSHPAWVCGLKLNKYMDVQQQAESHPAWVCGLKHNHNEYLPTRLKSHPAWVCGLKHQSLDADYAYQMSHPAWVCGLKRLKRKITLLNLKVTPCVGVWIETAGGAGSYVASYVTPCVGVWIETSIVPTYQMMQLRHTLRGCVD